MGLKIHRLGRAEYRISLWSGEGGLHVDGHWHIGGRRIIYAAQSLSLAQLEVLAHIPDRRQLPPLVHGTAQIPEAVVIEVVEVAQLPAHWRRVAPYAPDTQRIGMDWLQRQSSAVLKVPSAISDEEWNFLLNPAHPDFGKVVTAVPQDFSMDSRLP